MAPNESRRRTIGRTALAVAFGLLTLNAWIQVAAVPLGHSGDPPLLVALQAAIGIVGTFTTWAIWTGSRWAPAGAALYGVVAGGMLVALPGLLGLDTAARNGIWTGAASVLVFSFVSAWYLRRTPDVYRAR